MNMAKQPAKAPSQRQLRVAEEIRHALSRALERGDIYDPDLLRRPVTITKVDLSPDMRNAMVSFTPLGGGEAATALAALHRQKGQLRLQVAQSVHTKFVPQLRFVEDKSFDVADHIGALLRDPHVARDLKADTSDDQDKEDD
ncbi:MAG: 30S ribosome-binding factor RbfA [Thalassospira sp.]|nr:30S ribosome-binding factor RbfA [Thalassospira sp.]